MEGSVLAARF